jgi:hypothetical protein
MAIAKRKSSNLKTKQGKLGLNGKKASFRDLKAFGLWADRDDLKDPVQYTKALRARMEHGNDAR